MSIYVALCIDRCQYAGVDPGTLDPEADTVLEEATRRQREAIRQQRRERARPVGRLEGTGLEHVAAQARPSRGEGEEAGR